jgi:hypothetical protein
VAGNIKDGVDIFGVTGTYPLAPVPKTGQTISYTVGDDGDLEMGVEWPSPRFITGTTGVVTDTLTGLVWLENADCAGGSVAWTLAISYSNALYDGCTDCFGTSGDCGLSDGSSAGDWRLPNRFELESLLHLGVYYPAVPNTAGAGQWSEGDPFSGVKSSYYWSSTTTASATSFAWYVALYGGYVSNCSKLDTHYVWPVRGGQ